MYLRPAGTAFEAVLEAAHTFAWKDELVEAVKALVEKSNEPQPKLTIHYSEPVSLRVGRRSSPLTKVAGCFFFADDKELYFRQGTRYGHKVSLYQPNRISKIVFGEEDLHGLAIQEDKRREAYWKKVAEKRFDNETWSCLHIGSFPNGRKLYDLRKVFNIYELDLIRSAFEKKEYLSFRNRCESKNGRDFGVQTQVEENGEFRGWFTSYYPGTLNGDVYALINPTTAAFLAHD